ncbi:hypothetical protein LJ725_25095 [Reyranella aquatilis]|uniref:Uncharacterized protein n=1 Tax=Reyranella aquatilis TaxID=2035356 RepID=A0ABS8L1P6_9HYPH|nr:hypothetical protein [Reyranella aquatilis]MCC8432265.1 hypothetical protein [Reyranella aquatilis]
MTPPEIELLLHRMLWPVFQVRWEAARRLAELIDTGDIEAARGLITWISERRLESEVIIGLSVIDTFDLASHFNYNAVVSAVRAPSHLSDTLMQRLFNRSPNSCYGFGEGTPRINAHIAAYFHKKMGQAIPLSFQSTFEFLQERTGLPFLARWEYEWQWLQGHVAEPLSSSPHWFSWEDQRGIGHFDLRQREVYLSAFLRTLAYAAHAWGLDRGAAERIALEICPLDRGLARLVYGERPSWTQGLASSALSPASISDLVWKSAEGQLASGRALLSVRAVDISELEFKEIEVDLVAGCACWSLPEDREGLSPLEHLWLRVSDPRDFQSVLIWPPKSIPKPPYPLTVVATPGEYARWHIDLFPTHLQVASPEMFNHEAKVELRDNGIGLAVSRQDASATRIWNTSWSPTKPDMLSSRIGRATDVRTADLQLFLAQKKLRTRRLAYIRMGRRKTEYSDFEVERTVFWLDEDDGC